MATVKRIFGDYTITTIDANSVVTINTASVGISGNVTANNITVANTVSFPTANISANNITSNSITSTGNFITTGVFIGDGSGLTNIPTGVASGNRIQNGTSKVDMPNLSGNIEMNVGGVANVMLLTTTGATLPGNVAAGNILTDNYYFANGIPFVTGGTVKWDAQATAPTSPDPGDFWFSTVNGIVYQYVDDGDSSQWVDMTGIATPPATTSTTANSVVQRDTNGSITANNIASNTIVSTGSISATYFVGNGSLLTGIATTPTEITSGTSTITFVSPSGSIYANVAGTTAATITSTGVGVTNIINLGGNGTGNIGSSSGYFNNVYAQSTSALYADLAEIYEADDDYVPGTVLIFHGAKDLTTTTIDHDSRVAGVVSTNPAYVMNSGAPGLQLALTGRVPCLVQGPVNKGDVLVTSTTAGVAQAIDNDFWKPGCTLGKSLGTIEDDSIQVIEIAVGRY